MPETIQRRAWTPSIPAALVLPARVAEQAATDARALGLAYTASLYDAAAAAWHAALCTLGCERERLNRAGEAAWCAAAAHMAGRAR